MRYEPKKGLYWFNRDGTLVSFGHADHLRRSPLRLSRTRVLIDLFNPNPINAPLPIHSFIGPIIGSAEANLRRLKGQDVTTCFWANDRGSAVGKYLAGLRHVPAHEAYAYATAHALEPDWEGLRALDTKSLVDTSLELWAHSMRIWGISFDKVIYESDMLDTVLSHQHPYWVGGPKDGLYLTRSDGSALYAYADVVAGLTIGRQYDWFISYVGLDQKLFGQKVRRVLQAQGAPGRLFKTVPLIRHSGIKMSKRRGNTLPADAFGAFDRLVFRWACLRRTDQHLDVDLTDLTTFPEHTKVNRLVQLLKQPPGTEVNRDCLWLYYNLPALSVRQILDRIEHLRGPLNPEGLQILWVFLDVLGMSQDLKLVLTV